MPTTRNRTACTTDAATYELSFDRLERMSNPRTPMLETVNGALHVVEYRAGEAPSEIPVPYPDAMYGGNAHVVCIADAVWLQAPGYPPGVTGSSLYLLDAGRWEEVEVGPWDGLDVLTSQASRSLVLMRGTRELVDRRESRWLVLDRDGGIAVLDPVMNGEDLVFRPDAEEVLVVTPLDDTPEAIRVDVRNLDG